MSMPERNSVQYYPQDEEIDLKQVARRFTGFIKRNLSFLVLSALIGLGLGLGAYQILPRTYQVQMIADSRMLSSQVVVTIVESWQELLRKGGHQALGRKMNLKPEVLKRVQKLEAEPTRVSTPTKQNRDVFTITASLADTAVAAPLQEGIIYYLENNEFMKERTASEKRRLSLLKRRIEQEIAQLDSVKGVVQNIIRRGASASSPFISDPGSINGEIVGLYNQLLDVDQNLEFINNVQLISSFNPVSKADSPSLIICLAAGLMTGVFSALLIIFLRSLA